MSGVISFLLLGVVLRVQSSTESTTVNDFHDGNGWHGMVWRGVLISNGVLYSVYSVRRFIHGQASVRLAGFLFAFFLRFSILRVKLHT